MKSVGWIFAGYLILIIWLIIYSYTQVDLNLTLSANHLYQSIQKPLTHVGYFNRPLSAILFLILVAGLFGFYFLVLHLVQKKLLSFSHIKYMIGLTLLLVLAYPAFSHDFFNYMFDARIVTHYGLDPHFFKALDFPADTWTRFMHWTHRYYPYGGGFLLISLIPSLLGVGKFVLTLFLFKLLFCSFHLLTIFCIWAISKDLDKKNQLFVTALYALNPLILVESLVSPHNEVLMIGLCVMGVWLLLQKRALFAIVTLAVSVSIKYISIVLAPLLLFSPRIDKPFFIYAFWLWVIGLIPIVMSRELYPWYLTPLIALSALSSNNKLIVLSMGFSSGMLLTYLPWLFTGEYNVETQTMQLWLFGVGFLIAALSTIWLWKKS